MSKTSKASTTSIGSPVEALVVDGYVKSTTRIARRLFALREPASDMAAIAILESLLQAAKETHHE